MRFKYKKVHHSPGPQDYEVDRTSIQYKLQKIVSAHPSQLASKSLNRNESMKNQKFQQIPGPGKYDIVLKNIIKQTSAISFNKVK